MKEDQDCNVIHLIKWSQKEIEKGKKEGKWEEDQVKDHLSMSIGNIEETGNGQETNYLIGHVKSQEKGRGQRIGPERGKDQGKDQEKGKGQGKDQEKGKGQGKDQVKGQDRGQWKEEGKGQGIDPEIKKLNLNVTISIDRDRMTGVIQKIDTIMKKTRGDPGITRVTLWSVIVMASVEMNSIISMT